MKTLLILVALGFLFLLCWPLALLVLVLWPLIWLLALPFRLFAFACRMVLAGLKAMVFRTPAGLV